ncbi:MAG: DUF433 domain-containing protein [Clostridiales bacterium]|jgi:uncharacterized protein (DUF433 family)|nr:DUF433 domain-containing protein [Clostridiales bacterium]
MYCQPLVGLYWCIWADYTEDIISDYPYLKREDIIQALQYAAWSVQALETGIEIA